MDALPFIARSLAGLPRGDALDVACGSGRHVALLASLGFRVTGIDRDEEALRACAARAPGTRLIVRDVENDGLPEGRYDVVVTTFFLYRPLIPSLRRVLRPGGTWLLETFHVENHLRFQHPRRRAFALEPGEAESLASAAGFTVVHVDEGLHEGTYTTQLVARSDAAG